MVRWLYTLKLWWICTLKHDVIDLKLQQNKPYVFCFSIPSSLAKMYLLQSFHGCILKEKNKCTLTLSLTLNVLILALLHNLISIVRAHPNTPKPKLCIWLMHHEAHGTLLEMRHVCQSRAAIIINSKNKTIIVGSHMVPSWNFYIIPLGLSSANTIAWLCELLVIN